MRYAIAPLAGEPDRVGLCQLGQRLAAGFRAAQLWPEDVAIWRTGEAKLDASGGLVDLDGPAVLTACRRVGEELEVRFFNPTPKGGKVRVLAGSDYALARPCRLDGESAGKDLAMKRGLLELKVKGKEIVTVRLRKK